MSEKIKVICVVGPTASGKTELSVEIAKKYNIPIVVKSTFIENEGTIIK